MPSHYIFSTFTNDQAYTNFEPTKAGGGPRNIVSQVIIKGGANRADVRLFTPKGVMTVVDDQQLEALEQNPLFRKHRDVDHRIVVRDTEMDPDKCAADDMNPRDGSAPLTPNSPEFKRPDTAEPVKDKKGFAGRVIDSVREMVA